MKAGPEKAPQQLYRMCITSEKRDNIILLSLEDSIDGKYIYLPMISDFTDNSIILK